MGGSAIAVQVAKELEKYDVKVKIVEPDEDRCAYLVDVLPHCKIVHGDATDSDIMEEEAGGIDAFAALSDRSETNILSCLMSKEYGVCKTIAEVENIQFVHEAERLNIGTIINKKTARLKPHIPNAARQRGRQRPLPCPRRCRSGRGGDKRRQQTLLKRH